MYYTRRRSKLLDSLDYLIPPVKKLHQTVYKDYFLCNDARLTNQDKLLIDRHRAVFANPFYSKTSESDVQTCSSLILKKTTKQLIHEQYSILNLSTCNCGHDLNIENKTKEGEEDKPIIKVTVIPTAKETQTCTVFNKRCSRHSTKVQCTVSNQDNSIKKQNIYLLTKGRKREKIHHLKVSESAKLSNSNTSHKYGDISIKQLTESRQIINSLNMDKRKRKNNKNKQAVRTNVTEDPDSPKERYGDVSPKDRKSRVTVIGQIGLTSDDRYVLKCAAALNDKPIETNFVNDDSNPIHLTKNYNYHHGSSQYRPRSNINNYETSRQFRQQDFDVQTDIDNPYYNNVLHTATQNNRGTSQSTQVNFNFPNTQSIKQFRNQTAQCNCNRATTANTLETEVGDKVLKECQSPLVIISVYPRPEKGTDANDTVKIIQRRTSPERKELSHSIRSNNTQANFKKCSPGKLYTTNKMESKLLRSRSPSPKTKIVSKDNLEKKMDSRGRNNNSVKKGVLSKTRSHKPYIINRLEGNTSCHCHDSKFLQTEDFNRPQIKTDKSIDTEEVKKALVNCFLRNVNVTDKDNKKTIFFKPKDDASKVTINIDGENDRYDVLLEHSIYDTGVAVKKTRKSRPNQVSSEEEINTKSLENFLLIPKEKRRKGTERAEPPDVINIKATGSRLNIKDSIEIFRRQGEHSNNIHLKNDKYDFADTVLNSDFYAPVKHFRGDDCSLSDPNERDREIRELLGIMRCHPLQNTENTEGRPPTQFGCCCRRECSTGMTTSDSISKLLTKKCLKNKCNKHEATQIHPPDVKERTVEKSDPDKEVKKKTKISKKYKMTQKSINKHVSEHPELKASEEETSEPQTGEDFSKELKHSKRNDASRAKTILKKNYLSGAEKHARGMQTKDGTTPENLTLHRNIQIFLQVEQFNKQRPVVLNRKQYEKVKKVIECTISKKLSIEKRKRCSLKNCNVVSVGEIKVKSKLQQPLRFNREIQTDRSEIKKPADGITDIYKVKSSRAHDSNHIIINKQIDKQIATDIMVAERYNIEQVYPRQAVSSMEIRYASVEYKKRVMLSSSSTRFKNDNIHSLQPSNAERNGNSIYTIFKGHKRTATPNLGTSAYSLYSNITDISKKSCKQPPCAGDFKPKKPFLQRLISCLIMRSTQTSNIKNAVQKRKLPSFNNSLDSYHISTSLGALEMTSSLYDTSASFYSNHTTMPVNKMKRGFLSSVRGFLTSRRS